LQADGGQTWCEKVERKERKIEREFRIRLGDVIMYHAGIMLNPEQGKPGLSIGQQVGR
jgi:hypothetical protein